MSYRNTVIRSLHDVGMAAWFGGSLMGAVGLNGASQDVADPAERIKIASAGWARWAPVNAAAIAAHLVGGAALIIDQRNQVRHQPGVTANTVTKGALTVVAMGTTAYSGVLGAKLAATSAHTPAAGGTEPSAATPPDTAKVLQQQRILQWVTPVITGVLVVMGAQQGELQRPGERLRGLVGKVTS